MIHIGIEILNASSSLLGIQFETLYMSDEQDDDNNPIIEQYKVFSIGFIFITISFSINKGVVETKSL